MHNLKSKTVAQLVSENYKAADVFKKHNIDFCCGGGVSVMEICKKKDLNYLDIESELLSLDNQIPKSHDFNNWELDVLIDYIIQRHHSYVLKNIALILEYSKKVARVHGQNYPENIRIKELFEDIAAELTLHLQKEESILFPRIISLGQNKDSSLPQASFGTVLHPIRMMEREHENAGDIFREIKKLSNQYTPPDGACNTYKVLYAKLKEFEEDLHQHIHLENNILFPKALHLEKTVMT